MQLKDIKCMLFEIYAAVFQEGYMRNIDIVTAYENWWKDNVEELFDDK